MNKITISLLFLAFISSCSPKMFPDEGWKDKTWVLYELNGAPVQTSETDKDAHLAFSPSDKSLSGSGGCNPILGSYNIGKKNVISFINPATAMMSCPDLSFETSFLAALKTVDHYSIEDNKLVLLKGKTVVMRLR